jgi:hypothetical protein
LVFVVVRFSYFSTGWGKYIHQMVDTSLISRVFFGAIQKDNYFGFANGPMQKQWRCSGLRSFWLLAEFGSTNKTIANS